MTHASEDTTRPIHHRTRIKLCGFTRQKDVESAVLLGADALGFVFYPKSKRYLDPEAAHRLVKDIPAFVTTVALFVEPEQAFVHEVIDAMQPGLFQFHGAESPEYCDTFAWPYVKAFRVGAPGMDTAQALLASCHAYGNAKGWLFDSYTPAYGGSGHGFDRSLLDDIKNDGQSRAVILSGGLNVESVGSLVTTIEPWAVDISSGIELAPGEKCPIKMRAFIEAVRRADVKRQQNLLQN
ncbi:phosphoribosylanthranilate isomerase [Orrella marina]|uniref:N-(5'-phosphoribosyl)anthranilate isomerase n=1 Tax=Orrella marina TaxID=2163011 RepID=A0A2R4XP80_9BURK|nr:phosphoribosylanthranilate isomerase [Orrella marina]AWB35624.1 N-(5'-phosphoribosyl)anthranilate isomerase [Orrella marina]